MRVYSNSAQDIGEICKLLLSGEVVAIPTETVYGLAADALNPEAVAEIYRIKGRPSHNPLIVHLHDATTAASCVELNPVAEQLMEAFWPGPLTLVLPKKPIIPEIVTAGLSTLGVRMPNHPVMLAVLNQLSRPLAAPSANPSNYISPTRVEHVVEGLEGRLKYVLDGGPCTRGVESTILDVSNPKTIKLLRPGPIAVGEIESAIHQQVSANTPDTIPSVLTSPGQMKAHYRPRTPVTIGVPRTKEAVAYIHFSQKDELEGAKDHFFLSRSLNSGEAEVRLYDLLQQLDRGSFSEIVFDPVPDGENWNAIRDRLTRASCRD